MSNSRFNTQLEYHNIFICSLCCAQQLWWTNTIPPPLTTPIVQHSTTYIPTHGICVLPAGCRAVVLVVTDATNHSVSQRHTSKWSVQYTSKMADFQQGITERCSVCKTEYPTCMTCLRYGKNHKHFLDTEKSRNCHDNASFTNDAGKSQTHWNKTEGTNKSEYIILFSILLSRSACGFLKLSSSLFLELTTASPWVG